MATYQIDPNFPNVLIIVDNDLYNNGNLDRLGLRDYINSNPTGMPVNKGSHDFWIYHPYPNAGGGVYFAGSIDHNESPRKRRGMIRSANS